MKTEEALTRFLKKCEDLGKSQSTRRHYYGYLRHFAQECEELPLQTQTIELYLKRRKETPGHRGMHFKCLQAFYSYLEQYEGLKSPVPPKGPMGRPRKHKLVSGAATSQLDAPSTMQGEKVVRGGHSVSISTSISTAEAVQKYITWKVNEGVSKRTVEEYQGKLGAFARAFPVLPLHADQISQFLGELKVDAQTKWDYRKHIIAFYHYLEKKQLIPIITPTFPKVKFPRKVRRILAAEEMTSLFAAAQSYERGPGPYTMKAILTVLIDSKIRATELCTLTREKVFPDHIVVTGKTGERSVPISPETYDILTNLASEGLLFRVEGRRMTREYLRVHLKELMHRAGLDGKKLGPHILRHSSSVEHIMHGGDVTGLKEELGHLKLETTQEYAHLAFPHVKEMHGRVNVLGHIAPKDEFVRAICFGCDLEIRVALRDVLTTECLRCHQVGKWYLPEIMPPEMAEVKKGGKKKRRAARKVVSKSLC